MRAVERDLQLRVQADRSYAHHELVEESSNTWRIRPPGISCFDTTIALLPGRMVIVGDGPNIVIACRYVGRKALSWLATSHADYLAEKVLPHHNGYAWDDDVAKTEWRAHIDDLRTDAVGEDGEFDPEQMQVVHGFEHALVSYERIRCDGDASRLIEELEDADVDEPCEHLFGRVVSVDLHYARAAAARLLELLRRRSSTSGAINVPRRSAGTTTSHEQECRP